MSIPPNRVLPGLLASFMLAVLPALAHAENGPALRSEAAKQRPQPRRAALPVRRVAYARDIDAAVIRPAFETGIASWYGGRFVGRRTASGTRFDPGAMTAAHPWLPLGSRVRVTLLGSRRSVEVTITDRGGARGRVIDLSKGAAGALGMVGRGTARVALSAL